MCIRDSLEIEPQRAFDGDLTEAEVRGREDAADGDVARVPVLEVAQDLQDVQGALERDLAPLVAEALAHRYPERGGVDELHLAASRRCLAIGHHPDVSGD